MSDYMPRFQYVDAKSVEHAISILDKYSGVGVKRKAAVVAGGTDLLGEMKDELTVPEVVINLRSIPNLNYIKESDGGVNIGALTTLWDIQESDLIKQRAPVLVQATREVATVQIRQLGTLGGNINQRPRCWYYRVPSFGCYKKGGDFCYAVTGENQYHAVFAGELCYIVHPSDTAPALMALGASARVVSPKGERTVSMDDYFIGPRTDILRETILTHNEIMINVQIPNWPAGSKGIFLKYRERGAWDFAIVSLAMVVSLKNGVVDKAGIALSGVAPVPYRVKIAEQAILGKPLNADTATAVASITPQGARPMSKNAYKVDIIKGMVRQAVLKLAQS